MSRAGDKSNGSHHSWYTAEQFKLVEVQISTSLFYSGKTGGIRNTDNNRKWWRLNAMFSDFLFFVSMLHERYIRQRQFPISRRSTFCHPRHITKWWTPYFTPRKLAPAATARRRRTKEWEIKNRNRNNKRQIFLKTAQKREREKEKRTHFTRDLQI